MPSLKPLKSVAHNLAHQFASTLNYWTDDYAIAHLARVAGVAQEQTVVIDVLTQTASPSSVHVGIVAEIVPTLKAALFELLRNEGFVLEKVTSAKLKYTFNVRPGESWPTMPTYDCLSTLETSEGRKYEAHLTERNS